MQNNNSNMWVLVFIIVCFALFVNAVTSSVTTNSPAPVDRNTAEHRYATKRLRQEGYNTSEAQQAADAIIKFHEAQKARKR